MTGKKMTMPPMLQSCTGDVSDTQEPYPYRIEWDEPGAGQVVDRTNKIVFHIQLPVDWTDSIHPKVDRDALHAVHLMIECYDPAVYLSVTEGQP